MEKIKIEAFKPGEHTDSAGNKRIWTDNDINAICTIYNERVKADPSLIAPIVKGHPENNDPAFGWVDNLSVNNEGVLIAELKEINPEFKEEVKNGAFKKVSIALYPDLMLRHIGFLGAVPPAVKGLENVKFNENDFTDITIEFSETKEPVIETVNPVLIEPEKIEFAISLKENLKRDKPKHYSNYRDIDFADPIHYRFPLRTRQDVLLSMRSFSRNSIWKQYTSPEQQEIAAKIVVAAEKFGIKRTPKIWKYAENGKIKYRLFTNYLEYEMNQELFDLFLEDLWKWCDGTLGAEALSQLQGFVDEWKGANVPAEPATPAPVAASEPAIPKEYAEKLKEYEIKINELTFKNRMNEFREFLTTKTNLTPVQRDKMLPLLEVGYVYDSKAAGVEFSENGKSRKIKASDLIKEVIDTMPDNKLFSEVATADKADVAPQKWEGINVSQDRMDLHNKILQFMENEKKAGKEVDYLTATNFILKGEN